MSNCRQILAERTAPVAVEEVMSAVREAGFAPSGYREHCPDVAGDDADLVDHFLLHGYAERRFFPVALRMSGVQRVRKLPLRNSRYGRGLLGALVQAWTSALDQTGTALVGSAALIDQLSTLGGEPYVVIDGSADRRFVRTRWRGSRFLIPIAIEPTIQVEPPAADVRPPYANMRDLVATLDTLAGSRLTSAYPTVWGPPPPPAPAESQETDIATLTALATTFVAFLAESVSPARRKGHVLSTWLPPLPSGIGPGGQLDRTEALRLAGLVLSEQATAAGFDVIDEFESLLGNDGLLDPRFIYEEGYDQRALDPVLSGAIWRAVAHARRDAESDMPSERFQSLLRSIRANQRAPAPRSATTATTTAVAASRHAEGAVVHKLRA